ncbi:MAG: hypothetical protein NTX29_06635 [Actinobacteria bacterium]|nr:hypothetical protein [Actinomycetota bacterium]
MTLQPVILTTPQRRHEHVDSIATAFADAEGFANPIVYCDERGDGAAIATRKALALAAAGDQHVLFLEDDVLVDHEAPTMIAAVEFPPGVAAITFCDMREVSEFAPAGLYRRSAMGADGRGWWGNQALLIHRDVAAACVQADWFSPEIESARGILVHKVTYDDDGRNCSDIRLALLIHALPGDRHDYAVHVPSLFKHVGHESVCFPGRSIGERETRNWIADRRSYGVDSLHVRDD